ncbi:hypothetical protein DRZ78_00070 [Candidatus Aerophobetes bacterium]|uniref:Uncharacterized protein n=1 Tax=Aerophobetes bacterium TaxID=2030807 RepID=A0A662D6K0_UNCAE|nr:MAG: hypothetical protein DRZ78_00070 [Candidatus Aerophobetes bacterium]
MATDDPKQKRKVMSGAGFEPATLNDSKEISSSLFLDTKERIYRLLIQHIRQAEIARLLGVSRQYVNQVTKELEEAGVIKCMNPGGKPKSYAATGRGYAYVKQNKAGVAPDLCRVHLVACRAMILRPPTEPIKWTKTWTLPNGTQYFLRKELLDIGIVSFVRVKSASSDQLIIFMPEKYMSPDELQDHETKLEAYTQRAANWFMKTYGCQLGLLELNQKPHFAFEESSEIAAIVKKLNLSWPNFWIDDSGGHHDWETTDKKLAIARAEAPQRILILEEKVAALENTTEKIIGSMERLETKIDELLALSQTPLKPPDNREVV